MASPSPQWQLAALCLIAATTLIATTSTSPIMPSGGFNENDMKERCHAMESNTSCHCSPIIADYEIQCPGFSVDPIINIRISPLQNVQIDCSRGDANDYALLPELAIGDIRTVQIRRCPLPPGLPIQTILKRLGITRVAGLLFESGDLGGAPMRIHFKGLDDLRRLRLSSHSLADLPEDVFDDLGNLTWLNLRSNKVSLPPKIFAKLENLDFLELVHNNLENLEPGIFRHQKRLQHLNLWSNNLKNLSRNVFEGVESIRELDLSANNIETFNADVFTLLKNMTNINLNGNYFKSLPEGLFAENTKLSKFRLNNNRVPLETLPAGLLSNLPELNEVRLSCGLITVPADLFAKSVNIQNITITDNDIESLPAGFLADQTNLIDLNLSGNKLTQLPDRLFRNTGRLISLSLARNQLTRISSGTFSGLTNLQYLYADHNQLSEIDANAFSSSRKLVHINMEHNRIDFDATISEPFENNSPFQALEDLQTLMLRNNSITRIYEDWMITLLKLSYLDLSYNNITAFADTDLQFLSREIAVNLTHNHISEISFRDLNHLDRNGNKLRFELGWNPLECDCTVLHFVQYVRGEFGDAAVRNGLDISTANLECVKPAGLAGRTVAALDPNTLLCPLDYESTREKRCPPGCKCDVRLATKSVIVNCSNMALTKVPALPRIAAMGLDFIELHVENNNLMKLPSLVASTDVGGYADVRQIYARNNRLTKVSATNLPPQLQLVDFAANQLKWLNASVFAALNSSAGLAAIYLADNPWQCDCQAVPMLAYTKTNYKQIRDLEQMKCHVTGRRITEMSIGDACPPDQGLVIAVSVLIALFGLCIGTAAALYYKYQQEIKVWLFAHNLCMWFVTEAELDRDKKYDAFISYSHKDEDFITEYLVPELETGGPKPFKLCLHIRDWIVGEFIPNQIVRSVDDSRRTIVVLSPNFIESIWGRMEFRAAHTAALTEGRARVIVVIYGEIGDIETLDPELRAYLKMNTYVKWGDPWFWDKLRYAMPHHHVAAKAGGGGLIKTALKSSTDDKLELIKASPGTPPPALTTPPADLAAKNPLIAKLNGTLPNTQTTMVINGNLHHNGKHMMNGYNGHVNGAFIINTNAKQSDV